MKTTFIFIRDLETQMLIGIYDHEKSNAQKVIVNLEASFKAPDNWRDDEIRNVVSYETLVNGILGICSSKHFALVETLAEEIAALAFETDSRILDVTVSVEKPDIIAAAKSVGARIKRLRA